MAAPTTIEDLFPDLPPDVRKDVQRAFRQYIELVVEIAAEARTTVDDSRGTTMIMERSNADFIT